MKVEILNPKGYCAGVINAIKMARKAKQEHPNNVVYVLGMLVHNHNVVDELEKENIHCLYDQNKSLENLLLDLPNESVIVFTAHGHDEKLDKIAKEKSLICYDAVCPKVKKNLDKIKEQIKLGNDVIYIGIKNHPETEAALSISDKVILYNLDILKNNYLFTNSTPYVVNQTTLNYLELESTHKDIIKAFPHAVIENEICNATRVRQENLINIDNDVDLIIVVGDKNSSNSNRLYEIAKSSHRNAESIMISNVSELDEKHLQNKNHIVISSGASTPPEIIDMIYNHIIEYFK